MLLAPLFSSPIYLPLSLKNSKTEPFTSFLACLFSFAGTMPALYLFNRRTLLAGDDLQLPSIAWGAGFAVELFVFIPTLLFYTIELTLTTDSPQNQNDDFVADLEKQIQRMQTEACYDATFAYTNKTFCYLTIAYLAGIAVLCATS